ncbi:PREDICTED: uncharacterized protein LOC105116558 isoform X2 [Populus euphratica]|uniref:Uncharacterized protein LOC105116558 isoform X2 n=1 Tax=Populus euphratica TaxID=75702 RepID=A0AAJ6XBC0_POPEU|nr:PREDICTED: uncharacterized protein LOC105116558 isoform X2 [Populus euphratica]
MSPLCSMDALRTGKLSSNGIRLMDHLLWKLCYPKQHPCFTVILEAMKGHQDAVTDVEPSLLSGDAPRQIYIAQLFYASLLQVHFLPKACDRSVALENTDFSLYLRAKWSMDYAQKVFLHAVLFVRLPWVCHQPRLCSVKTLQWKEKMFLQIISQRFCSSFEKLEGHLQIKLVFLLKSTH